MNTLEELSTVEYFLEECLRFRDIMCNGSIPSEKKRTAFGALTLVYLNLDDPDDEKAQLIWQSTAQEFATRLSMIAGQLTVRP